MTSKQQYAGETFTTNLSGFRRADVDEYLERVAVVFDMLEAEGQQPLTALPFDLRPAEVRRMDFKVSWRGYDQDEVRAHLLRVSRALATHIRA